MAARHQLVARLNRRRHVDTRIQQGRRLAVGPITWDTSLWATSRRLTTRTGRSIRARQEWLLASASSSKHHAGTLFATPTSLAVIAQSIVCLLDTSPAMSTRKGLTFHPTSAKPLTSMGLWEARGSLQRTRSCYSPTDNCPLVMTLRRLQHPLSNIK
jgi:hypothetical protein